MKKTLLTVEEAKKSGNALKAMYDDLRKELGDCTKEDLDKVGDETLGLLQVLSDAIVALMTVKEDVVIDIPDKKKDETQIS